MYRLNLGSGPNPMPGYVNIDLLEAEGINVGPVYPLSRFSDGSCNEVRASHVLEHFPQGLALSVLEEWVRVLVPGGLLKVAVPDFAKIAQAYVNGDDWNYAGYVMGGQTDQRDFHKALFDEEGLREAFRVLGLVDIGKWEPDFNDCSSLPVSLNLCGRKPHEDGERQDATVGASAADLSPEPTTPLQNVAEWPKGRVRAVSTQPRLGFTDHAFASFRAFAPLGIEYSFVGGAYWHQGMSEAIDRAIAFPETEFVITTDYDTPFSRRDVEQLLSIMAAKPEIDALAPIQMKREEDSPLFAVGKFQSGPREISVPVSVLEAETMPVRAAHFGCTVLRASRLREMKRPWMMPVPDPTGGWGEGRMDADISFWHNWHDCGFTLHLANRVVVGHIEQVVSWPSSRFRKVVQSLDSYRASGKPLDCWR